MIKSHEIIKNNKGFTLIEILVAIIILGILSILVVPNVIKLYQKARIESFKTSVKGIAKSVDNYIFNKGEVPESGINVSELDITNKRIYTGKFIKNESGRLEADNVSDGVFCAKGEMENLYVEVGCENLDTTAPIVSINLENKTTNTMTLRAIAMDEESGIFKYEFKIDDGEYIDNGHTDTYTFTGVSAGIHTIYVRVTNGKGLISEASKEVNPDDIVAPTYTVVPQGPATSKTVTINYPERQSGFIYTYSIDMGDTWVTVDSGTSVDIVFNANGTIIARIYDGVNYKTASSLTISQIDSVAPVITLIGSSVSIAVGTPYTDPGATVTDNEDATRTILGTKSANFDTSIVGTYTITYNATDAVGNVASPVIRTITVTTTTINAAVRNTMLPNCVNSGGTYTGTCRVTGGYDASEDKNDLVSNYIWYSGFIWRVVNVNTDGTVKMVTEGNIANSIYSTSSTGAKTFDSNEIKTWLNTYFLGKLKGTDALTSPKWCIDSTNSVITDISTARTSCTTYTTNNYKLGLLTLDEFNLSGGATGSYLFNGGKWWTATAFSTQQLWAIHMSLSERTSNLSSSVYPLFYTSHILGVRPAANVTATTIVTRGDGSKFNPYILNEYKDAEVTNQTLLAKATVGEFVKLGTRYYRVVDVGSSYTKLSLDSLKYESNGYVWGFNNLWNTASIFTTTYNANSQIGNYLDTTIYEWLAPDATTKGKIVSTTWYRGTTMTSSVSTWTNASSLANSNSVGALKVGIPKLAEILSGWHASVISYYRHRTDCQSVGYDACTYTEYLLNYNSYYGLPLRNQDGLVELSSSGTSIFRPVIFVNSSLLINGGTGTYANPYQI